MRDEDKNVTKNEEKKVIRNEEKTDTMTNDERVMRNKKESYFYRILYKTVHRQHRL